MGNHIMKLCNDTANAAAFAREIDRSVYERLLNMPFAPPETGGIIGGRGGRILEAVIEERDADSTVCQYSPDVDFLNQVIAEWEKDKKQLAAEGKRAAAKPAGCKQNSICRGGRTAV